MILDFEGYTLAGQILRARQIRRVTASIERLDDEIYEAAVNGREARTRYLEYVREQFPRWLAESEERSRQRRVAADAVV